MSRLMSSNNPSASIYEQLRQQDDDSDDLDVEDNAGLLDQSVNRRDGFITQAMDDSSPQANGRDRRFNSHAAARGQASRKDKSRTQTRSRRPGRHSKLLDVEEADDDVPASLLIDHNAQDIDPGSINLPPPPSVMSDGLLADVGPSGDHLRYRNSSQTPVPARPIKGIVGGNLATADPREKAMFRWANVIDLDNFLLEAYCYYMQHGFWSTLLARFFKLLTVAFVIGFSIFLTQCIDYREIRGSTRLSEILVSQCTKRMGFVPNALLWITSMIWLWNSVQYLLDIPRLSHMHDFFLHLLEIPEQEVQSISWQEIVSRIMALRDSNPTISSKLQKTGGFVRTQDKQRLDAHDIANRLMRRQNYMIAMINKDVLDLTLPIPFLRNRKLFTRTLEWNLELCILDFVFNRKGHVRPLFLKDTHRKELSASLRTRFVMLGMFNLIFAPFLAMFLVVKHFFQNFNDYQKNPSQIGIRDYTPYAQWKFREFNELGHLFQQRINMSYPFADRYMNQFPKDKTIQIARFVSLISGAVVSVLGLATVLDQENFLNFEITPGRTTIFYIGIFGSIWAVARGLLPDDNEVYDTAYSIQEVITFTHYEPAHWQNRLHTVDVKEEFGQLYQMKLLIFLQEVLSIFTTPFVLWFVLPQCSERIIDFFREFTVHVDGIGYVCTFAEFRFMGQAIRPIPSERTIPGEAKMTPAPAGTTTNANATATAATATAALRDDYFASKDNKLEQSYWGFMNDYAVRNPRSSSRRRFNFPPPIPGLPSPSFAPTLGHAHTFCGEAGMHARQHSGGLSAMASPPATRTAFGHLHGRGLGSAVGRDHTPQSPLQSLLLDPHHQPSASGFGTTSPQALRPRVMGSQLGKAPRRTVRHDRPTHNVPEEDDDQDHPPADLQSPQQKPVSAATHLETAQAEPPSRSATGALGSWKYEIDSSSGEASGEEENEMDILATGPLGLIRQFRKARGRDGGAEGGF